MPFVLTAGEGEVPASKGRVRCHWEDVVEAALSFCTKYIPECEQ